MNLGKIMMATALAAGLTLTGCSVDQTEEARVPDVQVTEPGNMPEYDVDTAEMDVTTEERTVDVPEVDVTTEEQNVEVPEVDVTAPDDNQ